MGSFSRQELIQKRRSNLLESRFSTNPTPPLSIRKEEGRAGVGRRAARGVEVDWAIDAGGGVDISEGPVPATRVKKLTASACP